MAARESKTREYPGNTLVLRPVNHSLVLEFIPEGRKFAFDIRIQQYYCLKKRTEGC